MPDLWEVTERARVQHERRLMPRIREALDAIAEDVADEVRSAPNPQQALTSADTIAGDRQASHDILETIYRQVAPAFGDAAFEGVRSLKQNEEPPSDWLARVRSYLNTEGVVMVQEITETTRDDIRAVLQQGVDEGLGVEDIATNLIDEWEALSRVRARRITRTEVVSASNWGSLEGARATGLEMQKEWIATPDSRTRESHFEANGQTVGREQHFTVGGYDASYPGDPGLPAHERINCRCSVGYIPASETSSVDWRSERNEAMRKEYRELMEDPNVNEWQALDEVSSKRGVSPHTARNIVHKTGHYAE